MIGVFIFILLCIVVFEMIIAWLKYLLDDAISYDPYEYCYTCNRGFCMETPMTKDCLKWQEEQKNEV